MFKVAEGVVHLELQTISKVCQFPQTSLIKVEYVHISHLFLNRLVIDKRTLNSTYCQHIAKSP